jgi:hypothetical protein
MHIQVLDVRMVRFLVVMGAESSQTFVIEVSFNWVYSADQDIESQIELFLVED